MCVDIIKMGGYHFISSYFELMQSFDFDNQLLILTFLDCRILKWWQPDRWATYSMSSLNIHLHLTFWIDRTSLHSFGSAHSAESASTAPLRAPRSLWTVSLPLAWGTCFSEPTQGGACEYWVDTGGPRTNMVGIKFLTVSPWENNMPWVRTINTLNFDLCLCYRYTVRYSFEMLVVALLKSLTPTVRHSPLPMCCASKSRDQRLGTLSTFLIYRSFKLDGIIGKEPIINLWPSVLSGHCLLEGCIIFCHCSTGASRPGQGQTKLN